MVRRFLYNTYGPGRTRPIPREESHWRDLGIRVGMQMRKPKRDPAHRVPIGEKFRGDVAARRGKQAMAAFLTPQPPG